ncbi:MAG: NHL repeat containing protein [Bacteroidetes bacterium]|nr:MAG: NHL repeat containing protein [Bacteroidota bacterium]
MKSIYALMICLAVVTSVFAQEPYQHPRLTKIWELHNGLKTTESVLYDPTEKAIYVSSINENPWQKDGNGYISKLSPDGTLISLKWATGLSAPKGMGISNESLFVTNIDEVVEFNLEDGMLKGRYTHPGAVNLNDIAVSPEGIVYVSDSKGDFIYRISEKKLEILSDSPEVKASNGLCVKNGLLLCGQNDRIVAINLKSGEITTYINNTGGIDGLESVGLKTYVFSDWSGHIYMVEPGKEKMMLLDTSPLKVNAADIGYNKSDGILYVPTFFNDGVVAYKLD